ncbi:unnamed protein product [Lampetra planeri]
MDMANHAAGVGRRRASVKDRFSAEDEALSQIAREAEARLAAKRAARAEAREFRMRDLEKQQKEMFQVQKKQGQADSSFGHIQQWMEDSERYSRRRRWATVCNDCGPASRLAQQHSRSRPANVSDCLPLPLSSCDSHSTLTLPFCPCPRAGPPSSLSLPLSPVRHPLSPVRHPLSLLSLSRVSPPAVAPQPSECSFYPGSSSRASSRASSLRASPVVSSARHPYSQLVSRPPTSLCRASSGVSGLSAATLASLGNGGGPRGGPPGWEGVRGGPAGSSRRGSGDTSASLESEACVRELRVRRHGDTDTGGHGDKGTRGQGGSVARG